MLGSNAIYLAREIATWGLIDMDETKQLDTLKQNKVIVNAFGNAIDDMATIMYRLMDNNRRSNLYGYKMKFAAIEEISDMLCASIRNHNSFWFSACGKNYNKIANDLEDMAKILDFEMDNNMTTIESYDKNYKVMPKEVAV